MRPYIFLSVGVLFLYNAALTQNLPTFTLSGTNINDSLPDLYYSSSVWGDIDNDGDFDLVINGQDTTNEMYHLIFINEGNNNFTGSDMDVSGSLAGDLEFHDADADGDLDLLRTGFHWFYGGSTMLYENTGNEEFDRQDPLNADLYYSDLDWGDFDNDGDPDFIVAGYNSTDEIYETKLFRNNGSGNFFEVPDNFPDIIYGFVKWIDHNNDDHLDLLISGHRYLSETDSYEPLVTLYENNGDEVFSEISSNSFQDLVWSNADLGDYDSDGDMDIAIMGHDIVYDSANDTTTYPIYSKIYRNDNNGIFTDIQANIKPLTQGSVKWADFDNDGDLDFIIAGYNEADNNSFCFFYENEGNDSFTEVSTSIQGTYIGDIDIADTDNDNDLDIIISGHIIDQENGFAALYINETTTKNTKPFPPSNLSAATVENEAILSWEAGSDTETPSTGLTYNVYIRSDNDTILMPLAGQSGARYIPAPGNSGSNHSHRIKNLPNGTYYWSVQAIDNSFTGSAFAPEDTFTIEIQLPFQKVSIVNALGTYLAVNQWGDFDDDGDLDLLSTGTKEFEYKNWDANTSIYVNDGTRLTKSSIDLIQFNESDARWGDYDNDGDLDIVISGLERGQYPRTVIYKNEGDGYFRNINAGIIGYQESFVEWFDFDNDGDLDLIIGGSYSIVETGPTLIYENTGSDNFIETGIELPPIENGTIEIFDYDQDGDFDISFVHLGISIYYNESLNPFDSVNVLYNNNDNIGYSKWVDHDNDGDMDIVFFEGKYAENLKTLYLLKNDSNESFEKISLDISIQTDGYIATGDLDNNGYTDLLITSGKHYSSEIDETQLILNKGNDQFERLDFEFQDVYQGSASICDFNNDSKLDVLISGTANSDDNNFLILYRNFFAGANNPPSPPDNLQINYSNKILSMNWSSSSDPETSPEGLEYNLYVKNENDELVVSPHAHENGSRKIMGMGNAGKHNSHFISNLPDGIYYWGVQAIDPSGNTSAFREGNPVTINNFIESTAANFVPADRGAIDLGDIDNDGDLDIAITGSTDWEEDIPNTNLYRNNGDNTFTKIETDIVNVSRSEVKFGDYNGDGLLDLAISGFTGQNADKKGVDPVTRIYKNTANGNFDNINADLQGLSNSEIHWADVNNDGDLDLIITGWPDTYWNSSLLLYENMGNDQFNEKVIFDLRSSGDHAITTGDYDSDGDIDIIITGNLILESDEAYHYQTILLRNDLLSGKFEVIQTDIKGVIRGSLDLGDYDSDGDLDLIISGQSDLGEVAWIYDNYGNGVFIENKSSNLRGFSEGKAKWGDYDGDGDLDIVITGSLHNDVYFYTNHGKGSFRHSEIFGNIGKYKYSDAAWGDIDQNGTLDLAIIGDSSFIPRSKVFLNNYSLINTKPLPPTTINYQTDSNRVIFRWNDGYDAETSINGLYYNINLSNNKGSIVPSHAHNNGSRKIIHTGNASQNKSITIYNLQDGIYSFSVQTIDNNFYGSDFSQEINFSSCFQFENEYLDISYSGEIGIGSEVEFTAIDSSENIVDYSWDFDDGSVLEDGISPVHKYENSGVYNISLEVTNEFNCTKSVNKIIEVIQGFPVTIMTVITPNSDGSNDNLFIENITRYPENEVRVTNVFGNEVYFSQGYQNDWPAVFNGSTLSNGNYIVTVKLLEYDETLTETITVIR